VYENRTESAPPIMPYRRRRRREIHLKTNERAHRIERMERREREKLSSDETARYY
jgi:hypothetical protein